MVKCPICEKGMLKKSRERKVFFGVDLGEYPIEKCTKCGETFTDGEVMKKIEEAAKKKGIWGLGKKTKITFARSFAMKRLTWAGWILFRRWGRRILHPRVTLPGVSE